MWPEEVGHIIYLHLTDEEETHGDGNNLSKGTQEQGVDFPLLSHPYEVAENHQKNANTTEPARLWFCVAWSPTLGTLGPPLPLLIAFAPVATLQASTSSKWDAHILENECVLLYHLGMKTNSYFLKRL